MNEPGAESKERVAVEKPEKMNLLGLLMRNLLATNLADDGLYERVTRMRGDVRIKAGGMSVVLRFGGAALGIVSDTGGPVRARVGGSMPALLGMVAGQGMVKPFLTGAVRIGGNPFVLLKMLPLIRAPKNSEEV